MIAKCVACGKTDELDSHKCGKLSEAARIRAMRIANDEELRFSYETPERQYSQRLTEGLMILGGYNR